LRTYCAGTSEDGSLASGFEETRGATVAIATEEVGVRTTEVIGRDAEDGAGVGSL
jgi:hypothetical protein